ncbi:hypothetical protein QFZ23_001146 [Arthrobacter globiformis]|nr:hypothetical protein [Arthrobacter globiformis]
MIQNDAQRREHLLHAALKDDTFSALFFMVRPVG